MKKDVVISLYDFTGNMVKPWADAGYTCYCIDIQHSIRNRKKEGNIYYMWGDVRTWLPPSVVVKRIAMIFAFPPCTHVTVSGARDFMSKGTGMLRDSLEMFAAAEHAARWNGARYMIENPVGKFSDHMREPDFIFQPWQYGDMWNKRTCLWVGNGFVVPKIKYKKKPVGVTDKMWFMGPGEDRQNARSETPINFAKAVFEANKGEIREKKNKAKIKRQS